MKVGIFPVQAIVVSRDARLPYKNEENECMYACILYIHMFYEIVIVLYIYIYIIHEHIVLYLLHSISCLKITLTLNPKESTSSTNPPSPPLQQKKLCLDSHHGDQGKAGPDAKGTLFTPFISTLYRV